MNPLLTSLLSCTPILAVVKNILWLYPYIYCIACFNPLIWKQPEKEKKKKKKKPSWLRWGCFQLMWMLAFFFFFLSVCLDSTECAFLAFYVLSVGPIGTVHRLKKVIQTQISNKFWVSVLFTYLKIILL